jgi:hypothetical protein
LRGNHGSIGGSWPIAISGSPRGHSVRTVTRCRSTQGPTTNLILPSNRASQEPNRPDHHSGGWNELSTRDAQAACRCNSLTSKHTRFFLPNRQSDRCDLPCQGETRHCRPPPFGQKSRVKLLERSRPSAGGYRRTPEDIFQIGIVVFVQAQHGDSLSVSSQLPSHIAVFAAVMGLESETTVGP